MRKPEVFCFRGVQKETSGKKWVSNVQINPLAINVPHHIETNQLICIAIHLTGFYMMGNIGS